MPPGPRRQPRRLRARGPPLLLPEKPGILRKGLGFRVKVGIGGVIRGCLRRA